MITIFIAKELFFIVIAIFLACIVHEAGHYFTALFYGRRIKFSFSFSMLFNTIPIPRFIWYMPDDLTDSQKRMVAMNGFLVEFLSVIVLTLIFSFTEYLFVFVLHIFLYKYYAGENSDFRWLNKGMVK